MLSFVLGKNCLGGLTWLEIVGIFLPQQDLPGWSFVTGNSLVSHCLVASYFGLKWSFLGGSSLQCSCSFLNFPFWNLQDLLICLFLQRNFLGGVSGWGCRLVILAFSLWWNQTPGTPTTKQPPGRNQDTIKTQPQHYRDTT